MPARKKPSPSELRAKEIDKAIRLVWSSLESHLYYTHSGDMIRDEDHEFHQKCVQEYSEILLILSKLY